MKLFQVDIDENGDEVKYTEVSWLDLVAKEAARLRQFNSPTSLQEFRSPNSRRLKVSAWVGNRYSLKRNGSGSDPAFSTKKFKNAWFRIQIPRLRMPQERY
jgi:hypothetical protein